MNTFYSAKLSIISAVCIGLLVLTGVTACSKPMQNKGPSVDEFFQRFDTDGDDQLSQEEFPGPDEHFSNLDTDSDGFIAKDEMTEVPPPPRGERKQ